MTQQRKESVPGRSRIKKPALMLLAPCLKAIIDSDDNLVSLIGILQELTVSSGELPPPKSKPSVAAQPWNVLTIWKRSTETSETFVQTMRLVDPNGKTLMSVDQAFSTTATTHRIRIRSNGFPLTIPGEYWVKIFIRTDGSRRKSEVGRYPVVVKFSDEVPRNAKAV